MMHDIIAKAQYANVAPPVITEGKDTVSYTWDNIGHVMETFDRVTRCWPNVTESHNEGRASESWDLRCGWSNALKYIAMGWEDGAKPIVELAQSIPAKQRDNGETFGPVGRKVSISRYLAGDPNCMRRKVRSSDTGKGKAIRLVVNVAVNGMVNAANIANYGAALVACIDDLERAGFRVEVSVHSIFGISKGYAKTVKFVTGYTVKNAGDVLDYGQLAFCIGHPASERRIQFALAEYLPTAYETRGYGQAGDLFLTDVPDLPAHAIILNGWRTADKHSKTLEEAVKHCREEIGKTLGGDFIERLDWADFGTDWGG